MPAVLVRTDFRHAGDQREGDPWNLMNSFYPRTATLWLNSMDLYQQGLRDGLAASPAADAVIQHVAGRYLHCPGSRSSPCRPSCRASSGAAVYDWLASCPASIICSAAREEIGAGSIARKLQKGCFDRS